MQAFRRDSGGKSSLSRAAAPHRPDSGFGHREGVSAAASPARRGASRLPTAPGQSAGRPARGRYPARGPAPLAPTPRCACLAAAVAPFPARRRPAHRQTGGRGAISTPRRGCATPAPGRQPRTTAVPGTAGPAVSTAARGPAARAAIGATSGARGPGTRLKNSRQRAVIAGAAAPGPPAAATAATPAPRRRSRSPAPVVTSPRSIPAAWPLNGWLRLSRRLRAASNRQWENRSCIASLFAGRGHLLGRASGRAGGRLAGPPAAPLRSGRSRPLERLVAGAAVRLGQGRRPPPSAPCGPSSRSSSMSGSSSGSTSSMSRAMATARSRRVRIGEHNSSFSSGTVCGIDLLHQQAGACRTSSSSMSKAAR